MGKRKKIEPLPIKTREAAAAAVVVIGNLRRAIAGLEAGLNDEIAKLTEAAEKTAQPYREQLEAAAAGLEAWCTEHRKELTNGGKTKTIELGTGTVAWRRRPPSVRLRGKVQDIIARCLDARMPRIFRTFVRTKYELNKEAMLARPDKAEELDGVTIVSAGEDFAIDPLEAEIAEAVQ
jgi:phage host-nuclease inhibitor protein Gam